VLAPAKTSAEMAKIVWNDRIDAALCVLFIAVVLSMIWFGIKACIKAYRAEGWTAREAEPAMIAAE
jgi:carbon starvation protein